MPEYTPPPSIWRPFVVGILAMVFLTATFGLWLRLFVKCFLFGWGLLD